MSEIVSKNDPLCLQCVYFPPNLPEEKYAHADWVELQGKSCSFDYMPGSEACRAMRKTSCSLVDLGIPEKPEPGEGDSPEILQTTKGVRSMTDNSSLLNGVDSARLADAVGAIQDNPKLAQCEFRTVTHWVSGAHARTHVQGFYGMGQEDTSRATPFLIESDEPPVLLGTNKGPNPVELLLTGLAACITVGLTYNAAVRGLPIEQLTIELRGTIDLQGFMALSDSVRPGFQGITVHCHVKSPASDEDIQALLEHVKHVSPVYNTVSEPTPVELTFQRV